MQRTAATLAVSRELLAHPVSRHYGYDLSRACGHRPGAVYPILDRMLHAGWIEDDWEDTEVARQENRQVRRYYMVTPLGLAELSKLLGEDAPLQTLIEQTRAQLTRLLALYDAQCKGDTSS